MAPDRTSKADSPVADRRLAVPASQVMAATHGDRTILLDLDRGWYYGLDEVGTSIWKSVQQRACLADIVARLADEYDAPRTTLTHDAAEFLEQLSRARLISWM